MLTPIVFTTEPAAGQLGHQVAGRTASEGVLYAEQDSSTGGGDTMSTNMETARQDHFIGISLPD